MYFDVLNCPRHVPRTLVDAAVVFSYDYHGIPEELAMEVEFVPSDGPYVGSCEYDEEEFMAFVYISRKLYPADSIKTIFHEITHVQQRLSERLIISEDYSEKIWDGVTYSFKDVNQDEYNNQPWEEHALFHEDEMFALFLEKMRAYDTKIADYLDDQKVDMMFPPQSG